MKTALVIGCKNHDKIVKAQREPFFYHKNLLRERLNLKIKHIYLETFAEIEKACRENTSDIIFLLPSWHESPELAEKSVKSIRETYPQRIIVFIDPFAQTSTNYFNLLPYVDRFLKRQRLANLNEYHLDLIGGSTFTEFVAQQWGFDFSNWSVKSQISEGYEDRIYSGWNLGAAKKYKQELQKPKFWFNSSKKEKEIDVFCRLSLGTNTKKKWYCEYRIAAIEALKPLEADYKLAVSGRFIEDGLVSSRQYLQEIKSSRIVFSPFGWGENCWRDFEAICYDCLLIKPSMSHIDTQPNIFIPEETYIPVRWDFADLEDKCRYYLTHLDETKEIVNNARRVYQKYFEQGEFVETIKQLITK
jgi:hypothetical protein